MTFCHRSRREADSPLTSDGIFGNARVGCQDDHASRYRLADEYPVEGVFVIIRDAGKLQYRGFVQGQRVYIMTGAPLLDEIVRRFRQRQLAQFVLDDDLPRGGDAQEDFVAWIGEVLTRGSGQLGAI